MVVLRVGVPGGYVVGEARNADTREPVGE